MGQTRGTGRRRPRGSRRSRVDTAQTQVAGWIRSRAGRRGRSPAPIRARRPSLTLKPRLRVARDHAATAPVDREEVAKSQEVPPVVRGQAAGTVTDPATDRRSPGDRGPQTEQQPGEPREAADAEAAKAQEAASVVDERGVVRDQGAGADTDRAAHGRSLGDRPAPSPDLDPEQQPPASPEAIQDGSGLRLPHPGTGSAPNRSPLASVGNARSRRAPSRVRRPPWPGQPRTLRPPPGIRKPSASNLRPPPIPRPRPGSAGGPYPSGLKPRDDDPRLLPNIPRPRRDDHRLPPRGLRSGRRLSNSDPPDLWTRRSRAPRSQPRARRALSTVR